MTTAEVREDFKKHLQAAPLKALRNAELILTLSAAHIAQTDTTNQAGNAGFEAVMGRQPLHTMETEWVIAGDAFMMGVTAYFDAGDGDISAENAEEIRNDQEIRINCFLEAALVVGEAAAMKAN